MLITGSALVPDTNVPVTLCTGAADDAPDAFTKLLGFVFEYAPTSSASRTTIPDLPLTDTTLPTVLTWLIFIYPSGFVFE